MASINLKARIKKLERMNTDGSWLILNCESFPSDAQIAEMEAAHASGRFCILFIEQGDTAWIYSDMPKPWLH